MSANASICNVILQYVLCTVYCYSRDAMQFNDVPFFRPIALFVCTIFWFNYANGHDWRKKMPNSSSISLANIYSFNCQFSGHFGHWHNKLAMYYIFVPPLFRSCLHLAKTKCQTINNISNALRSIYAVSEQLSEYHFLEAFEKLETLRSQLPLINHVQYNLLNWFENCKV